MRCVRPRAGQHLPAGRAGRHAPRPSWRPASSCSLSASTRSSCPSCRSAARRSKIIRRPHRSSCASCSQPLAAMVAPRACASATSRPAAAAAAPARRCALRERRPPDHLLCCDGAERLPPLVRRASCLVRAAAGEDGNARMRRRCGARCSASSRACSTATTAMPSTPSATAGRAVVHRRHAGEVVGTVRIHRGRRRACGGARGWRCMRLPPAGRLGIT